MKVNIKFYVIVIAGLIAGLIYSADPPPDSIEMKIHNYAGSPVEIFWVNIFENGDLVKQTEKPIRNATSTAIHSFDGHEFVVKFFRGKQEAIGRFIKGPKAETVTIDYDVIDGFIIKQSTSYDEVMNKIQTATKSCEHLKDEEFAYCVANSTATYMSKIADAKDELEKYRDRISHQLRNYTCADDTMNSSLPTKTSTIVIAGREYTINTLFDTSHAKIWSVHNFVDDEECEQFKRVSGPKLRRATVAAEDGTSTVSENRKAQQAGYDQMQHSLDDPLWGLYHRVLHLTNHYTGMRLQPEGQEDFTVIQYNIDDQYTPHCDGTCDGSPHNPGGRVATAVLYCQVAERGGGTTFSKADVFVKPEKGMATFFSYRGPDHLMDSGYTEHSGCPVLEGEKWITTFWMRDGLTLSQPWTVFDPSGIPIMDSMA